MMIPKSKTILVTGATGRQGGAVVNHLLVDGWQVRAMTRYPDSTIAQSLRSKGVDVVMGDFDLPLTVQNALLGVYGVFSMQQPWEHGVDREVKQGISLVELSKKVGVQHFIYSSIGGAERNTGIPFFDSKFRIEQSVKNSGITYTIFRPTYFMENFLAPSFLNHLNSGYISLALASEATLQMIAVSDIGKFVAKAFNEPDVFKYAELEIAGDELSREQITEVFSHLLGKRLRFNEIAIDTVREKSADLAMMYDWLNIRGFEADISYLHLLIPQLLRFEQWLNTFARGKIVA